jgi:hypothetical protein
MKKYHGTGIFNPNENFSTRDELQITCITLNNSLTNNFFSLKKQNVNVLEKYIKDTMYWLVSHQHEHENIYADKINQINDLCNNIHDSTLRIPKTENNVNTSSSSSSETEPDVCKIDEGINNLLSKLPDKRVNTNKHDVLLKVDVEKLSSIRELRYKNITCKYR